MNDLELYQWMNAIGWTLLHSLWQALVLGGIILISFRFIGKNQAKSRYTAAVLGMLSILLTAAITFAHYLNIEINNIHISTNILTSPPQEVHFDFIPQNNTTFNFSQLEKYFPTLVNLWSLGILLLCLHMIIGYYKAYRLKYTCAYPLSKENLRIALQLQQKLNIRKTVTFKESGKVDIPCLIGYFKPVILLPVSMLSGIPGNQLEMIIAHELAHVYRHDYLLQTIQSIVEIIFFYHPMVWWLSSVVKTEREHICDDLAVKICGESLTLIKALNSMETIRRKQHEMILGFPGKKDSILKRAQRAITTNAILNLKINRTMMSGVFLVLFANLLFISNIAISETPAKHEKVNLNFADNPNEKSTRDSSQNQRTELLTGEDIKSELFIYQENGKTVVEHKFKSSKNSDQKIIAESYTVKQSKSGQIHFHVKSPKGKVNLSDTISPSSNKQSEKEEKSALIKKYVTLKKECNKPIFINGLKSTKEEFDKIPQDQIKYIEIVKSKVAQQVLGEEGKNGAIYIRLEKKEKKRPRKELVYVDGKRMSWDDLNKIPTGQIESMSHISAESAIEKYGPSGEHGVVELKLKKNSAENKTSSISLTQESKSISINEKGEVESKHSEISFSNSLNNTNPLFVIDGVQMDKNFNPQELDVEKVESVNVLKDGSAIALYGKKAENGAIEITTEDKNNSAERIYITGDNIEILSEGDDDHTLIILNGKEVSEEKLKDLNPKKIESVTLLEGKSAFNKYGSKAKDGVMEIQTKKEARSKSTKRFSKNKKLKTSNPPLIFLDGKKISKSKLNKIDPKKIESMNVIKNEDAIIKYGSKAKNGVIEITSKK